MAPSPHRLPPGHVVIEHWCNLRHHNVATGHLATHAHSHHTNPDQASTVEEVAHLTAA